MAMLAVIKRMNEYQEIAERPKWMDPRQGKEVVPHGFRSSFRDWAAETTNHPPDVVEMALAHAVGDKVEAAYRRGDLFEKRRRLMADWAKYCAAVKSAGTVVPMRRARA
jgi:integrase